MDEHTGGSDPAPPLPDGAADALVTSARDGGVDFDGLAVERAGDGFAFAAGDVTRSGLDEAGLRAAAAAAPAYVANWFHWERVVAGEGTPRRAFLRWVERAPVDGADAVSDPLAVPERTAALREGLTREWGELAVRAWLTGGERRYRVCHAADAERPAADLTALEGPSAVRRRAKRTDGGRYRPLSTAPTLPTGWVVDDVDGAALVRAVDAVYPASVANWHRERRGDLDVTHFRSAAGRQTGIYRAVSELDSESLEHLVAATCVDEACLKRREWDETGTDRIDVPRGDGAFPCREPCSLFLAAAREIVRAEREEPREYTVELTPAEREQLAGLLDAVAEGRAGEVRDADLDDPANRYRARYLRAKRDDLFGCERESQTGDESGSHDRDGDEREE